MLLNCLTVMLSAEQGKSEDIDPEAWHRVGEGLFREIAVVLSTNEARRPNDGQMKLLDYVLARYLRLDLPFYLFSMSIVLRENLQRATLVMSQKLAEGRYRAVMVSTAKPGEMRCIAIAHKEISKPAFDRMHRLIVSLNLDQLDVDDPPPASNKRQFQGRPIFPPDSRLN